MIKSLGKVNLVSARICALSWSPKRKSSCSHPRVCSMMCDSVRKQSCRSYLKSLKTQWLQVLPLSSYHFLTIQTIIFIRKLHLLWEARSEETSTGSCLWTSIQHSIRLFKQESPQTLKHFDPIQQ